jgi:hypothetical protein
MKNLLKTIAVATLITLLVPEIGAVIAATDISVSTDEAHMAAMSLIGESIDKIPEWNNATLNQPVTYYAPDNTKSAYEFTVFNGDKEVGFIITSAQKDWMPILEFSSGLAPSKYMAYVEPAAVEEGFLTEGQYPEPKYFYWGAFTYSVQLSEKMKNAGVVIHLPTGIVKQLPIGKPILQMDSSLAKDTWQSINKQKSLNLFESAYRLFGGSTSVDAAAIESQSVASNKVQYTQGFLTGVPAFYQSSYNFGHGDDRSYWADPWPDCVGYPDDPWRDWDGCSPIAGAMVVGYWSHNGYPNIPSYLFNGEAEDILIDNCHHSMDTSYEGSTGWGDIGYGMRLSLSCYAYHFFQHVTTTASWEWTKYEIDGGRPFVLSVSGSSISDGSHSVCVTGYDDNANYLRFYNTWDTSPNNYVTWGDWSYGQIDALHPPA